MKVIVKRGIIYIFLFIVMFFLFPFSHGSVSTSASSGEYDNNEGIFSEKGIITYRTKMLTATNSITYGTLGFIIRLEPTSGCPIGNASVPNEHSDDYMIVYYTDKGVSCTPKEFPNGFTYSEYKFTQEALDNAAKNTSSKFYKKWQKRISENHGKIYLNGIFTTYYSGHCTGKKFYRHTDSGNLKGIKDAEQWRDPSRFWQYYDIQVEYTAEYPVTIKYMTEANELIKEKTIGKFEAGTRIKDGTEITDTTQYVFPKKTQIYNDHSYTLYESYYSYKVRISGETNVYSKTSLDNGATIEQVLGPLIDKEDDKKDDKKGVIVTNGGLDIIYKFRLNEYPVKVRHLTKDGKEISSNIIGKFEEDKIIKAGVNYQSYSSLTYDGKIYNLYRSYFKYKGNNQKYSDKNIKTSTIDAVMHPKDDSNSGIAVKNGGIIITFLYEPVDDEYDISDYDDVEADIIEREFPEIIPKGNLRADLMDNEEYDVDDGIPVTETLYANITDVPGYVISYRFKKKVGRYNVQTTVKKNYIINWETYDVDEESGDLIPKGQETDEDTKTVSVNLEIPYGYWVIDYVSVYKLDNGIVKNECIENGEIKLTPEEEIEIPEFSSRIYGASVDDHVFLPDSYQSVYQLPDSIQQGTEEYHQIVFDDDAMFEQYARTMVQFVNVRNDRLTMDGMTIIDDTLVSTEGIVPNVSLIPEESEIKKLKDKDLYDCGLMIPYNKENETYKSCGVVEYINCKMLGNSYELTQPEEFEINDVKVHTPVVCDIKITDKREYNQMVSPDHSKSSLILGMYFKILLPTTGTHNDWTGYGTRDYKKYTAKRQVRFPFGVYEGTTYHEPNQWITIYEDNVEFYLPTWVNEGQYEIKSRAISVNAIPNNKISDAYEEKLLNSQPDNYIAYDTINVQVTGRLYGLQIYDISSYPIWRTVFRKSSDSLKRSGFTYRSGIYNQNGNRILKDNKYTFPLVNGSHPTYTNEGAVKKGYFVRFELNTIGNMYDNEDYVYLRPKFYFVPYDGSSFTEVDLYYNETFNQERNYLVKVGSEMDKNNIKYNSIGNYIWDVNTDELHNTANILGLNYDVFKSRKTALFNFNSVALSKGVRTFVGNNSYIPDGATVPGSVGQDALTRSVQKWYGEYYIPSQTYAVKKGFDLEEYIKKHGSVDIKEDFWLKDGYIVVNFDITTKNDGTWNLSYINQENAQYYGFCNMWQLETGNYMKKTDNKGNTFDFRYGDFIMYYANKSVNDDYTSGGTH